MPRVNLYIQDAQSKRFLQSANTIEELQVSKNTIIRWNNEMGHPPPQKGAELLIESVSVLSTATYSSSRLRWKETDAAATHRAVTAWRTGKPGSIFVPKST